MNSVAEVNDQALPPQLRRLVRALGVGAALKLLRARGGTRLMLPKRASAAVQLNDLVGRDATAALLDAFQGLPHIDLPMPDKILIDLRDQQIRAEVAAGATHPEVALRHGLTTRHILNILQARNADLTPSSQGDLFGSGP